MVQDPLLPRLVVGLAFVIEVALLVLEVTDDLGLRTLVKTTGGKGLHIVAPIQRRVTADELRHAANRLTEIVQERRPDLVTAEFRKADRGGKVMLDPSRNSTGAKRMLVP